MYILCMILLVFFALIGLCAFVTAVADIFWRSSDSEILIILRKLSENSAEQKIRRAARIARSNRGARLICFCSYENPAHKICESIKNEYPFIEIIDPDRIQDII